MAGSVTRSLSSGWLERGLLTRFLIDSLSKLLTEMSIIVFDSLTMIPNAFNDFSAFRVAWVLVHTSVPAVCSSFAMEALRRLV